MAILDIIFLDLFLYLIIKGLTRGALADLLSLVAVVAGFIIASRYCVPVGETLAGVFNTGSGLLVTTIAFFLIVVLVNVVFAAFSRVGTKAVRTIKLGGLNRLLGGVTCFTKAAVIFYIVCTCILLANDSPPPWFVETRSSSMFSVLHDLVGPLLPEGFEAELAERFEELRDLLEQYKSMVPHQKGNDTIV